MSSQYLIVLLATFILEQNTISTNTTIRLPEKVGTHELVINTSFSNTVYTEITTNSERMKKQNKTNTNM